MRVVSALKAAPGAQGGPWTAAGASFLPGPASLWAREAGATGLRPRGIEGHRAKRRPEPLLAFRALPPQGFLSAALCLAPGSLWPTDHA